MSLPTGSVASSSGVTTRMTCGMAAMRCASSATAAALGGDIVGAEGKCTTTRVRPSACAGK